MITKQVEVTQIVEVTIDETKLTPEWMASFRDIFYNYHSVNDHLGHLAQLEARGLTYQPHVNNSFIEGYGNANDLGIKIRVVEAEVEVRS
jgi:hypothetical protein